MLLINNEPCYSPEAPKLLPHMVRVLDVGQCAAILDLQAWNLLWLIDGMVESVEGGHLIGCVIGTFDPRGYREGWTEDLRAALKKHPIQCAKDMEDKGLYPSLVPKGTDAVVWRRANEAAARWNSDKLDVAKITDAAEVTKLIAAASNVRQFRRA